MNDVWSEFVPVSTLADGGAFGTGSPHARATAARRWAHTLAPGVAEKRRKAWFVRLDARLPNGRTVAALLNVGSRPATLAGRRLPPGHERWGERERARFLDTAELIRRFDALRAEFPKMMVGSLTAIFTERHGTWLQSVGLSCAPDTVRRYRERIERDGNVDRRGRPRGGNRKRSPEAWDYFRAEWLQSSQPRVSTIHRRTMLQAKRQGWTWPPSVRTVQKWVADEIPVHAKVMAREGPRKYYTKCQPKARRDYESIPAGHHWCGDERTFDFFARVPDERKGWRLVRPILTAWLDLRSRKFVGYVIAQRGNTDSILAAFKMGATKCGLPSEITIDNGKDYRAVGGKSRRKWSDFDERRIETMTDTMGSTVHYAIPFAGSSKPIESPFAPIAERFDKLQETYCGNKPENRPHDLNRRLRDVMSVPTFDEFRDRFSHWLDGHHAEPQSGHGMNGLTPNLAFERYRGPIRTCDAELLDYLCRKRVEVKVSRDGVRHNGILYGRYARELYDRQGQSVLLLVDPVSAASVMVADLKGRPICVAENSMLRTATQEDVRANMEKVNRLKRITKEYLAGCRHRLRSTPEQIIATKTEAAMAAERRQRAELPPITDMPASVTLVRPDLVAGLERLKGQQTPPAGTDPDYMTQEEFDEMLTADLAEQRARHTHEEAALDFEDFFAEDDVPSTPEPAPAPFSWVERLDRDTQAG